MNRSSRLMTSRCLVRALFLKPQTRSNNVIRLTSVSSSLSVTRTFSTATVNATTPPSIDEARNSILEASLQEVHTHGWTEDAISAGVVSSKLPLSMMGIITPNDMIVHFMDTCQDEFQQELDSHLIPLWKSESDPDVSARLETAIRTRLQYVIPYVKSNTWHEGMALGATSNTTMTASQLDRMVQSIADAIVVGNNTNHQSPLGLLEQTAIGALYISTELFLLTDTSSDYQDTWQFCKARIAEMHLMANSANWNSVATGDAATAVATSLGGAVVSLLQPAARGAVSAAASTVVPHLATFLQPLQQQAEAPRGRDGTRASDYNVAMDHTDTDGSSNTTGMSRPENRPPVTAST